jgi:uncharacterized protein (TIGR02453 family)
MLDRSTFTFLKKLKDNNNKQWFDLNRPAYELARQNFIDFTNEIIEGIEKFDFSIAEVSLDAKKCISRINRDIRFSKNKTPYKTNFFALISAGGKKSTMAAYYLQIEPGNNSFVGGGVYMPLPPDLYKFRQEIDYGFDEWKAIVQSKKFKQLFPAGVQSPEMLKRIPKGYEESNPAIDYLKMKGYYTYSGYKDMDLQSNAGLISILNDYKATKPLIDFLNRAL